MTTTFDLKPLPSSSSSSLRSNYGEATRDKIRQAKAKAIALRFAIRLQLRHLDLGFQSWRAKTAEGSDARRRAMRVVKRMQNRRLASAVSRWLFEYER